MADDDSRRMHQYMHMRMSIGVCNYVLVMQLCAPIYDLIQRQRGVT